MVVDITAATVVLTSSVASPTNGPFTVTATYSEDVMGITDAGFTASNAVLSDFTAVSPSVYTILVTPIADGIVTIDMLDSAGYDTGGNDTLGADQISITYDIVAPTVVLTTPLSPTNAAFTVRATFSEPVTGVDIGDFDIAGGTASGFTVLSPTIYRITVIPTVDAVVTIDMTGGVASDVATNGNTGATQLSVTYDSTLPAVTLTSSPA